MQVPRRSLAPGPVLGVGLGAFFDGVVLYQLLQWHQMLSSWYPPVSIDNIRRNVLWDGLFHSLAYVLVVTGVYMLWRAPPAHSPSRLALTGLLFCGWAGFNLVEGVIDHALLGVHHVNETVSRTDWWLWDAGFLACSALLLVVGWRLYVRAARAGRLGRPAALQ